MINGSSSLTWRSFRERRNFPQIWFRDLRYFEVSKSSIWKHTFWWQWCFFFHCYLGTFTTDWAQTWIHRFAILCICWDTLSEKTDLWQLPTVSTIFKRENKIIHNINNSITNVDKQFEKVFRAVLGKSNISMLDCLFCALCLLYN